MGLVGLESVLGQDVLIWLLAAAVTAGLVRGFSGFGTAMIYLPVAGQVLEPVTAIVTLLILDLFGPLPAVPRAIRDGHPRDVLRLLVGAAFAAPFGLAVLLVTAPEVFQTSVSVLSMALLAALVSGIRYRGVVGPKLIFCTGALAGFLHGAVGLPGPPVILLYMARPLPVQVIRASVLLFLVLSDFLVLGLFALRGLLAVQPVLLGLLLLVPYLLAIMVGSWIFDPRHDRAYRWVAYAIIAASAIGGLPLWD